MAKYSGYIGFIEHVKTAPGVYSEEKIVKRKYHGDLLRNTRRYKSGEYLNDNLTISNEISIVADPYAAQNFHAMRFIEFMGTYWKIENVQVDRPRLILELGEVYHGETS